MNEGGGKKVQPSRSWEHSVLWVIHVLLAGMGGSELMHKGNDRNAGMYKKVCSKLGDLEDSCLSRVAIGLNLK